MDGQNASEPRYGASEHDDAAGPPHALVNTRPATTPSPRGCCTQEPPVPLASRAPRLHPDALAATSTITTIARHMPVGRSRRHPGSRRLRPEHPRAHRLVVQALAASI